MDAPNPAFLTIQELASERLDQEHHQLFLVGEALTALEVLSSELSYTHPVVSRMVRDLEDLQVIHQMRTDVARHALDDLSLVRETK